MSNQEPQKDIFSFLREDLAPAMRAAREAFAPHIRPLQQVSIALNKAFTEFINEHRESIELWVEFSKIYPQLEPYINNIVAGLEDPEFEVANDVVELAHIFESIDLQKDPNAASILGVISNEAFQKSLIDLYSKLTLDQARLNLIKEALDLHNKGFYGGSVCLLYGLIEGTLTESFEKANYIQINTQKVRPVSIDGTVNEKGNLTGLVHKLEHAKKHQDELESYYNKIITYQLVEGDPEQTIPKTRNKILHGGSVSFNTEKRSAQLILWLYSTILHVRVLGI